MVDRMLGNPAGPLVIDTEIVDATAALGSLLLLVAGLIGLVFSIHLLSAWGIFLFALFGLGSAALTLLGYRGWQAVCFAPPLGLGMVIVIGSLLVYLKIWSIGPEIFWIAAAVAVFVHVRTLTIHIQDGSLDRYGDSRSSLADLDDPAPLRQPRDMRLLGWEATLVGVGVACALASALALRPLDPGWGGLLGAISPAWYVGLLLVIAGIFVGQRLRGALIGLPVIALQLILTATPAIVYDDPRYGWTGVHVGVTSYILLHGATNPHIDIYQAWPGLFAGVAWLCKVSHFATPMAVARWWPPVIDLATLLVFFQLAKRILRSSPQAWIAATVFVLGYTIADADYYSPQSAALLLAIATFAVMFRHRDEEATMPPVSWVLLFTLSIADAITHQLSPYMVAIALVVLVLFRRSHSNWAPVVALVPAVAWALVYFSYTREYVSWDAFLNIFRNALTPGIAKGGPPPGAIANAVRLFEGGSALAVGIVALVALLKRRSSLNICLALCAASAGALVAANSYGNEAIFRVVLFALPWLAVLAGGLVFRPGSWSAYLWPLTAVALLVLYLGADMGLDFAYATRPGDLAALAKFEETAHVGSYLITIGAAQGSPSSITGRYNLVNEGFTPDVLGANPSHPLTAPASYQRFMANFLNVIRGVSGPVIGKDPSYYVLFGQQPAAYLATYNYATLNQYAAFESQFASSPAWRVVDRTNTSTLFILQGLP